jgi:hypothetical protein
MSWGPIDMCVWKLGSNLHEEDLNGGVLVLR